MFGRHRLHHKKHFQGDSLVEAEEECDLRITGIFGGPGMRHRLSSLGLFEGKLIRKRQSFGSSGPVIVLIDRVQVAVGRTMAMHISVERAAS